LLERYDPASIAAALYELWLATPAAPGPAPAAPAPATPAPATPASASTAKVWVGVGRNDGATPNDLVAVLTKEVRVPKDRIGRIEMRDAYMLVELPTADAERIADALSGREIRRKRVVAKLDRTGGNRGERAGTGGNRRERQGR
jgi:ATP-dependent RNA helicase DeaD